MPCNCGKKNSSGQFVFTSPDGQSRTYNTEVEAKAAKIRAGGGTVSPK